MNVIGLIGFDQNPAACLLRDGALVAFAEEERFTRLKGSDGMFPARSLKYCLEESALTLDEIDRIAFGWDAEKYPWRMVTTLGRNYLRHWRRERAAYHKMREHSSLVAVADTLAKYQPSVLRTNIRQGVRSAGLAGDIPEIEFVGHHTAHAYSAYFCSTFRQAGILTLDGSGEDICSQLSLGEGDDVHVVESIPIPHSLGWFYAAVTEYLGFIPYRDEGKLMGLAALGEERRDTNKWIEPLSKVLQISGSSYEVDPIFTKFGGHYFGSRFTDELVRLLTSVDSGAVPVCYGEKVAVDGEPRSKYLQEVYIDIAWAAQELLEEAAVGLARRLVNDYDCENICIAGGVGLNCKMNGEILRRSGCKEIFVQPASSDAGTALGAAMYVAKELGDNVRNPLKNCYFGPGFSNDRIHADLNHLGVPFTRTDNPCKEAADLIAQGKIIAWFQDRMEFGARALGGRSIVASPVFPAIKERVNSQVKYRESWRPFCPSLLSESKEKYLDTPKENAFMTVAYHANGEAMKELPAVVHVDGTVRPQTVTSDSSPKFYELISQVGQSTGHPVVLNTSFNVRSEPIICTPLEAVRCLFSNGLDALVMGDFILTKSDRSTDQDC